MYANKMYITMVIEFKLCQQDIVFGKIKPQGKKINVIYVFKYNLEMQCNSQCEQA